MSETIKAICVLGGDVQMSFESWRRSGTEARWLNVSREEFPTKAVRCERPTYCAYRELCTGKAMITLPEDNKFSQAIVTEVIVEHAGAFELINCDME